MGKKTSAAAVSKISSSAISSAPSNASSSKSSILRSSFAPSTLQLHLFASVIQSFESQLVRIHDINTGRLRQQHATKPDLTVTSLDWGYYGTSYRENQAGGKKKRRRINAAPEDVVLAYGTSTSEVYMYSPAEGRVVGQLTGGHDRGIKDFKFSSDNNLEAWSIGGDAKLVQWDLNNDRAIRTVLLPDANVSILAAPSSHEPRILCASTSPFTIDTSSANDFRIETYDSFKHSIHSIIRSDQEEAETFLAADSDRYINVFDIKQKRLVKTLVAGSEVQSIDLYKDTIDGYQASRTTHILAIVTRDGSVELFSDPLSPPATVNGDLKSKRKNMTKKADAQVKLIQQDGNKTASVYAASLQHEYLLLVSIDGGVEPTFQKVRWQDEGTGGLLFSGLKEIVKSKSISTLKSATMNGVKDMGKTHVDESRTVVVNGGGELGSQVAAIEITSSDDEDGEDSSDNDDDRNQGLEINDDEVSEVSDEEMEDADAVMALGDETDAAHNADVNNEEEIQEPSFGDLLAAKHPNAISIADAFAPERATLDKSGMQMALPSGMSLGTVLTQALRTNDQNLLESCLHANDTGIIQNTIQRLDSGLASILLSKLAERLASRPGRYGHLLSWVQWTCIAHGGAIAGQPDVTAKIRTLYKVLAQRSKSLDKLLLLKGKLDMLDAQLSFRKQLQAQRGGTRDDDDEPGTIYIEGEADNWSSDDDLDEAVGVAKKLGFKTKRPLTKDLSDFVEDGLTSEEDEEDMPITNGATGEISEDEEEDSDGELNEEDTGGLVAVEAEVSGAEGLSGSEDESNEMDDSEGSEADEHGGDDDDDEEDSSMDGFINDGEISQASDEDDIDIDEDETPRRPATKRSKHRD